MIKYALPVAAAFSLVMAGAMTEASAASKHKHHSAHKSYRGSAAMTRPNPTNSSPLATPGNGDPSKYTGGR